jgi:uncharacterized protein YhjY with autotransporter beta-barrel domain
VEERTHGRMRTIAAAPLAAYVGLSAGQAFAQSPRTFNDANTAQLTTICNAQNRAAAPVLGPGLAAICTAARTSGATLDVSGSGIITATPPSTLERERRKREEAVEAVEQGGGGSADQSVFRLGEALTLTVAAGAASVTHPTNAYEEPYHGTETYAVATLGAQATPWLTVGGGFGYTHTSAEFEDLGGFRVDAYRPFLFASATPFEGAFIDGDLGYGRLDSNRYRTATMALNPSVSPFPVRGTARGNPVTDEFSLGLRAGYDSRIGLLTIGPRVGLRGATWDQGSYHESSPTGLELAYDSISQNSVQSTLGVAASVAIETGFGVVLPQVGLSWVHEFVTTQPRITARFVEAPGSGSFSYRAQKPAGNFATLDIQTVLVLHGRWRPYVDFGTLLGNSNYQSYGGIIGVNCAF